MFFLKKYRMIDINRNNKLERAVLIGLVYGNQTEEKLKEYLAELEFLAKTAGAKTIRSFYQKVDHPDNKTYVRKGKLLEIKSFVDNHEIDLVIMDDEITPSQLRNIEKELKCKVLDRSMLILDIFAQRARTVQAKTQVELAQTQYMLPRLKGMWQHLDRIKGGIGMRGAGEKEIETDRRIAQQRIALLKAKLKSIDKQNVMRRKQREKMLRVALVGYTNVGKSTIMNLLTKSTVFAENKLFATLDTTVRKVVIRNMPFLLSDTVGFIRKLPHHLIESFKSTLDEVVESDVLLHVIDISHDGFEEQMKIVNQTLKEINISDKPVLLVFNKMDLFRKKEYDPYLEDEIKAELLNAFKNTWKGRANHKITFISAIGKENIEDLKNMIYKEVSALYKIRYPYQVGYFDDEQYF
jgi:GTPase